MNVLLDTGPLVAYVNKRDQYHAWSVRQAAQLSPPFYTCEAVLTEAHYLLTSVPNGREQLLELVARGVVEVAFSYTDHRERVNELMRTYENVPITFADACLVRMAEVQRQGRIFTTDGDFRIYRKHGDASIDVLMP